MADQARPRVALAALLVLTLLSFAQVFADGPYPGPALVGMLLAGAIALGAGRAGLRPGWTLALSAAGLISYLVLIFASRHSFYGLPSPGALRALGRAIGRAYGHSQVDFAPVPVRPGYVILVVIALWLSAAWGEVATSRWKAPWVAVLPPVALFSLVLVIGTRSAAPLLVMVFLGLLLTYLSLTSQMRLQTWGKALVPGRGQDLVTPLARRMAAASVAAAFAAPALLPSIGEGLLVWRNGGSGEGAGGSSGIVNPLVQIAPTLIEQTDQVLFHVAASRPQYWRLVSLTQFDGKTWRADAQARVAASAGRFGIQYGAHPDEVRVVEQRFELVGLRGQYLPAAATAFEVSAPADLQEDLRAHPFTGDLTVAGGVEGDVAYEVRSATAALSRANLLEAEPGSIAEPAYTQVPPLAPEVRDLLHTWTQGADTPGAKLIAIQDRLRGFTHQIPRTTEELEAQREGASADYLTSFLTEIRTGYCQQFATAFALLARSLGYPARVSVGFLPGSAGEGGTYEVRGTDAHAWPEVYFERYGWVPFEPTPRGEAAVPRYTLSRVLAPGNFQAPDAAIFSAGVRGGNLAADRRFAGRAGRGRGAAEQAGSKEAKDQPSVAARWAETFGDLLSKVLLVLALALAGVPTAKWARQRLRYRRAADSRAIASAAFAHFEAEARDLARPREPSESARRYLARLAAARCVPEGPASRLATLYEAAEYAPLPLGRPQAAEARRIASYLSRELWTRAGWHARLLRVFSPRSLLRSS